MRYAFALVCAWHACSPLLAHAVCLQPPGDVTSDALATVADVQCNILMNLWSLAGQVDDVPPCLAAPGSPAKVPDHNCDKVINVVDTQIAVSFALGIPLSPVIDADSDQCVDACQVDVDSDGDPDFGDCAPVDPAVFLGADEVCNGFDDDCDGAIDEAAPTLHLSCDDSNACTGIETCLPPSGVQGVVIQEVMVSPTPAMGEWFEVINTTTAAVNVQGWTLSNGLLEHHQVDAGGALFVPAGGYLVFGASADMATNGGVRVDYVWADFSLAAPADSIVLIDADGLLVDRLDYDASFPHATGAAMGLVDPSLNNDSAAAWATATAVFGAGDRGTPAGPNRDVMAPFCQPGVSPDCDDGNNCTVDACNAATGCTHQGQGGSGGGPPEVIWLEAFENGCGAGCPVSSYTSSNGSWMLQSTGTNQVFANQWYVSCAENGNAPNTCGAGCGNDESLHVGSVPGSPAGFCPTGDCGAAYDASNNVTTNRRAVSPTIDASGHADLTLSFFLIGAGAPGSDFAALEISTDGGANWIPVAVPGGLTTGCCCSFIDCLLSGCCGTQATTCGTFRNGRWESRTVSLPAAAAQSANLKIGWRWQNNSDNFGSDPSFAVDDLILRGTPVLCE